MRVALVTGANTGIGRVTAEVLAERGDHVFLACRSQERTRPVAEAIASSTGNDRVDVGDHANPRKFEQPDNLSRGAFFEGRALRGSGTRNAVGRAARDRQGRLPGGGTSGSPHCAGESPSTDGCRA